MTDVPPDTPTATVDAALHVRRLAVQRMYGRPFGLDLEGLDSGVNVIAGPNGSGKTTLARAMAVLLWPEAHDGWGRPLLEGTFRLNGELWRGDVEGSRVQYQKGGAPASPPSMPPPSHRDRYHVSLHDLLAATEDSERALADAILQEAQGGYDVPGAAGTLGFGEYAKGALKETRAVEEARGRVEEARSLHRDLERKERSLRRLRRERDEARAAARRREALAQALAVVQAEQERREAERAFNAFPEGMQALQGDEAERLERLRADRADAVEKQTNATEQRAEAETRIAESRLPAEGLPDDALDTLRTALQEWDEARTTVEQAKRERARAAETEAAEWERLSGDDKEAAAQVDGPEVDAVQSLAEARLEVRGREEALGALERQFGEADPETNPEQIRRGVEQLAEWLREPASAPAEAGRGWILRYVVLAGAIAVVALGAVLGLGGALLGWIVAGAGVVVAVSAYLATRSAGPAPETRRPDLEQRFERLDLPTPPSWSVDAVHAHLDSLLQDWTDARLEAAKAQEWMRHADEASTIEDKQAELEDREAELVDRLHVDPGLEAHSLLWFVQRLGAWQEAWTKVTGAEEKIREAERQAETWRDKVQAVVEPYEDEDVADISDGQAALEQLREDQRALEAAHTDRENAQQRLDQATAQVERIDDEIETLFDRLGLDEGSDETVGEWCAQFDEYEAADEALSRAERSVELERERLHELEGFEESMLGATADELERRKDEADRQAEQVDDLSDQISRIQQQVEDAKTDHDLEEALAEHQSARQVLRRRGRRDLRRVVGQALADVVHERTRNQDLPAVFSRADELFRQITSDRYRLDLDRAQSTFRVVTDAGRGLALQELSGGTKVQLLLAVRMAFVETQEQGIRPPLVLDEALANSDDGKAAAIIEAVHTIAAEGRQVFYLTAQSDEVAKWRRQLDETKTALSIHTLSGADGGGAAVRDVSGDGALRPGRSTSSALPPPDERSHEALERHLDVPAWPPRNDVAELHLWHLTDDVDLLCRAVDASYRRWGQLAGLAERDALSLIDLDPAHYRRLEALACAVEHWAAAWRVGRGTPVGRPALEATDAVSDTFIDEVTVLAERVGGEAARILDGLRNGAVKRFRSGKVDELEAYFRAEGHLTSETQLPPEAWWRRALEAVSEDLEAGRIQRDEVEAVLRRICDRAPTLEDGPPTETKGGSN
ncbi:AAA family ATPase [Salinibacter grassmerensis]|uniref:AAA family ATPase n=1 Tax=Salinibacter grassmerensis TaxID=3040353 RepID=UPI0021E6F8C2|nr:AAA family ATPase [Salinibacter grassmerensis]